MNKIEDIKEEIIERYNLSWENQTDNLGLIEASKQNFKERVELLIHIIKQSYEEKQKS